MLKRTEPVEFVKVSISRTDTSKWKLKSNQLSKMSKLNLYAVSDYDLRKEN